MYILAKATETQMQRGLVVGHMSPKVCVWQVSAAHFWCCVWFCDGILFVLCCTGKIGHSCIAQGCCLKLPGVLFWALRNSAMSVFWASQRAIATLWASRSCYGLWLAQNSTSTEFVNMVELDNVQNSTAVLWESKLKMSATAWNNIIHSFSFFISASYCGNIGSF